MLFEHRCENCCLVQACWASQFDFSHHLKEEANSFILPTPLIGIQTFIRGFPAEHHKCQTANSLQIKPSSSFYFIFCLAVSSFVDWFPKVISFMELCCPYVSVSLLHRFDHVDWIPPCLTGRNLKIPASLGIAGSCGEEEGPN